MRPLRYGPQLLPGSGFNHAQTRPDTARFAALFSGSYYHPACSCRLGQVGARSLFLSLSVWCLLGSDRLGHAIPSFHRP